METNQHTAGTTEERAFHSVKGKNDNTLACSEFQTTSEYLDGSYNSCICMDNLHCMYKVLHWFPYNTPISSICSFSEDSFLEQLVILPVFVICWTQDWERSEKGICGSLEKLRAFKKQLSQPIPDHNEDLQAEQIRCKVTTWTFSKLTFLCASRCKTYM